MSISFTYTFSPTAVIYSSEHNTNNEDLRDAIRAAHHSDADGTQIVNADIDSSAAIAYSKLDLSGNIDNADIKSDAGIVASKLDLSSVDHSVLPSADNTYDLGSASKTWQDIYCSDLYVRDGGYLRVYDSGNSDNFYAYHGGSNSVIGSTTGNIRSADTIEPYDDNTQDLGASDAQWQDIYCIDIVCDYIKSTESFIFCGDNFKPSSANTYDCGSPTYYWQDMYTQDIYVNYIRDRSGGITYLANRLEPTSDDSVTLGWTDAAWSNVYSHVFTDLSDAVDPDTDALSEIKTMKPKKIKEKWKVDHKKLPEQVKVYSEDNVAVGRSLGASVSHLYRAIEQLVERIEVLEKSK